MKSDRRSEVQACRGAFAFADVEVDSTAHRVLRSGRDMAVEPKAFAVLLEFLAHPGELLTRDQLLDAVWGHSFVTPATLNRIIVQLRRALADESGHPHCIQTVHGLGYRFIAPLRKEMPKDELPALHFAPPARARVPERTGPLIGREHDVERLAQSLAANRLVTVVGPGGIGKTQAALETARRVAWGFEDGVWLLDCAPLGDEPSLARLLAGTFGVRTASDTDDLIAHLSERLRARRALIVFDNCDRIAAQLGGVMAKVLAACPALHALVTSQCRLNCAGEFLFRLPALDLPSEGDWTSEAGIADLSKVAAVQLLLARLQTLGSGFALTAANATSVAELCQRLGGVPLALELAAAHLRVLGPEQLLERMDGRMLNLAEASPGRPARHQTLRALIDWSFGLLSECEQALLCGLSVFEGTCTFGGATSIGSALGFDDPQTIELLGGLVDKSLLRVDGTSNPPSYHLLDSVRLYARERLAVRLRVRPAVRGFRLSTGVPPLVCTRSRARFPIRPSVNSGSWRGGRAGRRWMIARWPAKPVTGEAVASPPSAPRAPEPPCLATSLRDAATGASREPAATAGTVILSVLTFPGFDV